MVLKNSRILDTEALFFTLSIVLVYFTLPVTALRIFVNVFLIVSFMLYWVVKYYKVTGFMQDRWKQQVVNKKINRFSIAVVILFLDRLHLLLAFSNILLFFTGVLFYVERGKSISSWSEALKVTLTSVGFQLTPVLVFMTKAGYFVAFLSFLVGYIILGILLAIFLRALEVIFKDY